jgi:hypothetical protein
LTPRAATLTVQVPEPAFVPGPARAMASSALAPPTSCAGGASPRSRAKVALASAAPAVAAHQGALTAYFDAYDEASLTRMDLKVMEVIQELEATRAELAAKHPETGTGGLDKALAH